MGTSRGPSTPQVLIRGLSRSAGSTRGRSEQSALGGGVGVGGGGGRVSGGVGNKGLVGLGFTVRFEVCVEAGASLGVIFTQCSSGKGAIVSRVEPGGAGEGVCAVGDKLVSVDGVVLAHADHEEIKRVLRRRHSYRRLVKFERISARRKGKASDGDADADLDGDEGGALSETVDRMASWLKDNGREASQTGHQIRLRKKEMSSPSRSAADLTFYRREDSGYGRSLWSGAQQPQSASKYQRPPLLSSSSSSVALAADGPVESMRRELELVRLALKDERASNESLRRSMRIVSQENEMLVARDAQSAKLEVEMDVARAEIQRMDRARKRLEERAVEASVSVEDSLVARDRAEREADLLRESVKRLEREVEDLADAKERAKTAEVQIASLSRRVEDSQRFLDRERHDYRESIASLQGEVDRLREERQVLHENINSLKQDAKDYENLMAIVSQKRGYSEQIVERMKAAEANLAEAVTSLEVQQERTRSEREARETAENRLAEIDASTEVAIQELRRETEAMRGERDEILHRLTRISQEKMEIIAAHEATLRELAAFKTSLVEEGTWSPISAGGGGGGGLSRTPVSTPSAAASTETAPAGSGRQHGVVSKGPSAVARAPKSPDTLKIEAIEAEVIADRD